mgnify:CR=1 FL=1
MNDEIYDVIIVGSGPAGLTAGIYASRANLKTLLLAGGRWGGQLMLTTTVENFPGFPEGVEGPELMGKMRAQAERFGVKVLEEDVTGVDFSNKTYKSVRTDRSYNGKSVIIATGAESIWLGVPNEYKLIGRGVSSCAPCDAPFFRDKKVVVVGGGDAAMEEALVLTKFASEVIMVHRRDSFRASKVMQDRVLTNPKIKVMYNTEIEEILGDQRVTGVKIKNQNKVIDCEGVFVAIGHSPLSKIFEGQLELDEKGYIKSHRHGMFTKQDDNGDMVRHPYHSMTSVEGVFVAGDVHDFHYRQAITASGYGCEAALECERWLQE